ncbi:GNAT family N-acetyltransferase [Sphingosinicella sp. CPCC 101087]|uniref:GNAT family N-acetyltransferase n=1 Tax=Sphingosinicella sp. CPCC 101087 TaxID=2497754 RepID=UPI0013E9B118|nr:GNAT family N-acetyltransferase [Sphingosinicella sp. CPCC 101087]
MDEPRIRPAIASDVPSIQALIRDAYGHYVERLGRAPAPMRADYEELVGRGDAWVLAIGDDVGGLIVLRTEADHLLVSNVAVAKAHQGRGFGRGLLDHAERRARQQGIDDLRLYTNALMHENLAIYAKLGWEEYDRREQDGFHRVFMRKRLAP